MQSNHRYTGKVLSLFQHMIIPSKNGHMSRGLMRVLNVVHYEHGSCVNETWGLMNFSGMYVTESEIYHRLQIMVVE